MKSEVIKTGDTSSAMPCPNHDLKRKSNNAKLSENVYKIIYNC